MNQQNILKIENRQENKNKFETLKKFNSNKKNIYIIIKINK